MSLVRKLKISKITKIPLTGIDKEIVDFINSILDNLTSYTIDNCYNIIFYMNSKGEWMLEQDDGNDKLYLRWEEFGDILQNKYFMKYSDIQVLIQYMAQQSFNRKLSTPVAERAGIRVLVEKGYKEKILKIS